MAKGKPPTMSRRQLSLRGVAMVDTIRGQVRIRKWPRKRGTPKSPAQRYWIDWFKEANFLAKYASALDQINAIEITKGTMLYPRDVMLKAMRGSLYWWKDEQGNKWMPTYFRQNVSDSLDAIGQTIGQILYRAGDRWRALDPGTPNQVLTTKGPGDVPEWRDSAAGGGAWVPINTYTPTVDGAANTLAIPLPAGYRQFKITGYLSPNANASMGLKISRDNQATWITGSYRFNATQKFSNTTSVNRVANNAGGNWTLVGAVKANARAYFTTTLYGTKDAAANQMMASLSVARNSGDNADSIEVNGIRIDTGVVTDIQLLSSTPWAAGSVQLLGLV